jgi:hypothetical protein
VFLLLPGHRHTGGNENKHRSMEKKEGLNRSTPANVHAIKTQLHDKKVFFFCFHVYVIHGDNLIARKV